MAPDAGNLLCVDTKVWRAKYPSVENAVVSTGPGVKSDNKQELVVGGAC